MNAKKNRQPVAFPSLGKPGPSLFQGLEKSTRDFPSPGKTSASLFQSLETFFPRATAYPGVPAAGHVRERPLLRPEQNFSERHLQCVWANDELRPTALLTARGERIEVESPGVWNLEAGPDFLGAALRLGPERRRVTGDVEIHIHPADWQAHGHGDDPRYERVRFHVTFFPGTPARAALPAGMVEIPLRDALATNPRFAFEGIDLTSYPHGVRSPTPPCGAALQSWSPDDREALLAAAGEECLRRRVERLAHAITERGAEQIVFEEVMAALGYKHNQAAFRKLAEVVPLATLRAEAGADADLAFALLAGGAGMLPQQLSAKFDNEARGVARRWWDAWWMRRERFAEGALTPAHWRLAGIRPLNHPLRRLAAAAALFTASRSLAEVWTGLAGKVPDNCLTQARQHLLAASHPFWDFRLTLASKRTAKPVALIGAARADVILINDFVPFLAARGCGTPFAKDLLAQLPVEQDNAVLRETAFALFGRDAPNSLLRDGLRRQGLLQIFHDYCLNDRSRCATCPLPAMLQK
ncbi:MAG: DUF2851 family protein [Kiritimatiellaeota bacterium]|nr:DUF2851 family protein [Kiritimatiellota bacterium]